MPTSMFGGSRGFGGSLGVSPMQRLAGGIGMSFGGEQYPQVMVNDALGGRGRPGVFGGGGGGMFGGGGGGNDPSMAALINMNSLQHMGDQAFMGSQAGMDRELQRLLQQRALRNNIDLANIDQGTQFGVQDRRNSGALDQINASGGWERAITGDKLGSNERLAGLQRDLDMNLAQGGWNQQGLDRASREKVSLAEMANLLQRQGMVGDQALAQIGAQGNVQMGLQGLEGQQAAARQQLSGQQALQQIGAQGGVSAQLQRLQNQGQLDVTGLGEAGANTRARLSSETQKSLSRDELQSLMERTRLEDATRRHGINVGAQTQLQGFAHEAGMRQDDRSFRANESEKERQFTATENAAQRVAQHGPPEHRETIRKFAVTQAAAESAMAQAQAKAAEAESVWRTDPRRGEAMLQQALAETARAQTQAKMADKDLADRGLNAELIRAQIKKEEAEAAAIQDPTRELKGIVDFTRQNPGFNYTGDSFSLDPNIIGRASTSLNPLVESQVQGMLPGMRGDEQEQIQQLRQAYPNLPEEALRQLLQRPGNQVYRGAPGYSPASDYAPFQAYSY